MSLLQVLIMVPIEPWTQPTRVLTRLFSIDARALDAVRVSDMCRSPGHAVDAAQVLMT